MADVQWLLENPAELARWHLDGNTLVLELVERGDPLPDVPEPVLLLELHGIGDASALPASLQELSREGVGRARFTQSATGVELRIEGEGESLTLHGRTLEHRRLALAPEHYARIVSWQKQAADGWLHEARAQQRRYERLSAFVEAQIGASEEALAAKLPAPAEVRVRLEERLRLAREMRALLGEGQDA